MIYAADFEELVNSCSEMLSKNSLGLIDQLSESIRADASYAAMVTMAMYEAATISDIESSEVDKLIKLAEQHCPPYKILDYKRHYKKFQAFEKARTSSFFSKNSFYINSSTTMQ